MIPITVTTSKVDVIKRSCVLVFNAFSREQMRLALHRRLPAIAAEVKNFHRCQRRCIRP
jgi:hypothetical protein